MSWNLRSDRLSVEELAPQTVSRPALALIRRRLGVSEVVGRLPEWSQCIGALHIGARGWAYNQCAQGVESALPEPELTM